VRLGLSTYTYTWAVGVPGSPPESPLSAADLLHRAHSFGVPVVQFADNLPLHTLAPEQVEELAELAQTLGVDLEVGTRGTDPAHLALYLDLAVQLGSPFVRIVVDTADSHPSPAEATATLRESQRAFERAGVILALENHDRFPSAVLAAMVRDLGTGWAGICLDTVNNFGALEGPATVIETLAPLAVNVHVKDFDVVREHHAMGFRIEGRPAGQGRLDVPALLAAVGADHPETTAVLELWTPPQASVAETVDLEARWAEASTGYLQRVLAAA
jgi:sugar phosphate isomerase/epimerase